jgi:hypothetical protein
VRPVGCEGNARLARDRRHVEQDRAVEDEIDGKGERLRRLLGVWHDGAAELGMDTVEVGTLGKAEARRKGDVGGADDLHDSRLLEPRHTGQGQHERGIAPAHADDVGGRNVADGWSREAPGQFELGRVDRHLEDCSVQRFGLSPAGDLERLWREHRPALLELLEALVALHALDAHRVGHDEERPDELLLGAPELADLGPHGLRPGLALPDQRVDEEQRDGEQPE